MHNEGIPDEMRNVWQSQVCGPEPPALEEIRGQAGKFRSQMARRNFREYAVAALLMLYFGYCAWTARMEMMRVGNILMMAGLVDMVYQLRRIAGAGPAPADMGWKTCVAFHRGALERQRDALRGVWKWYLGPLVPGLATIAAAGCLAGFRRSALAGMVGLLGSGAMALVLWGLGRINGKAAAALQRQIDALEAAAK
jgi:hypothetical protein